MNQPSGSDRWPAADTPHHVATAEGARRLAEYLLDPSRDRPVVVVSTPRQARRPWLDADGIADEVAGLLPVVVLAAEASAGLTDGLGDPALSVFAAAGRLYPVGTAWAGEGPPAPLCLCTSPEQGGRARDRLTEEALAAAHAAGLLSATPGAESDLVTGEVAGFSSDHHVVLRCGGGRQAFLHAARLRLDVPPQRMLRNGQELTGRLVGDGPFPSFVPELPAIDVLARVRREYPDGATVPAKVVAVRAEAAQVLLHPDFSAELTDPDGDLTLLLEPGDVIPVEVAWSDGRCVVALGRAAGSDLAMPVLPGGPPWLLLDQASPAAGEQSRTPLAPEHHPAAGDPASTHPSEDAPERALAEARTAVAWFAARAEQLEGDMAVLRQEAAQLRAMLRAAHLRDRHRALPEVFADEEAQFRWEVGLGYLQQVAEPDRAEYPLPAFGIGPAFLSRWDALRGIPHQQALEVVVDVLCGRAGDLPARDLRPGRSPTGRDQITRDDGAMAWQVSLPERGNSPRLLRFWRLPGGGIELDTVGVRSGAPG